MLEDIICIVPVVAFRETLAPVVWMDNMAQLDLLEYKDQEERREMKVNLDHL